MWFIRSVTCLLLTAFVVQVAHAGDPVTLGGVDLAYSLVAYDNLFVDELKLGEEQKLNLETLFEEWMRSDLRREIEALKADSASSGDQRFKDFESHWTFVRALNDKVLSDIDAVVKSPTKKRRFRQLLSQALARFGHYESLIRLHGDAVDLKKYNEVREAFRSVNQPELEKRVAMEVAVDLLVESKYTQRELIEDRLGGPFHFRQRHAVRVDLESPSIPDLRISKYARDDMGKLLRQSEVHRELKMTPRRASEATKLGLEYRLLPTLVSDSLSKPELAMVKAQKWMKEFEAKVDSVLSIEQEKRLRQILLQQYLREGDFEWALRSISNEVAVITPSISNELALLQNDWQAMVYFTYEARKLLLARRILEDSFGELKVGRYFGRMTLTPRTPWEDESNRERHRELRRLALREFAQAQRPENVRRNKNDADAAATR